MQDIYLYWYTLHSQQISATREQVRSLGQQLQLPKDLLSRDSTLGAFRKACESTVTTYTSQGRTWTLMGVATRKTPEFLTYQVLREQDGYKLAEWKFLQRRRASADVVPGSRDVKETIRKGLSGEDFTAARRWLDEAMRAFDAAQTQAPELTIRIQARETALVVGVPLFGRDTHYWCYEDGLEWVTKLRTFLNACVHDEVFVPLLRQAPDVDRTVFAHSAQEHLIRELDYIRDRLGRALPQSNQGRGFAARRYSKYSQRVSQLRAEQERHRRELGFDLTQLNSHLRDTEQMLAQYAPGARLPRVINQ